MKFFIDDNEIKTVKQGAVIFGSLNLVSRKALFSYIYNPYDSDFKIYKAKKDSSVLIKNDDGKNIFKGTVYKIEFETEGSEIKIQAEDLLSLLLKIKPKGRFTGSFMSVINKIIGRFSFLKAMQLVLNKEVNILNLGALSAYDIMFAAASKMYGSEFKIYMNGDGELKFLVPLLSEAKKEFVIGKNIISSSFSSEEEKNTGRIKAIGDDEIVSGSVIKIIEPLSGNFGHFIVEKDVHTYTNTHIMELDVKEKKFSYE